MTPPQPFPPLVEPAGELTVEEVRRYSRHVLIPDLGMTGQRRLRNSRVLCIGAGGLGSPVLMYLAAAGVGTIGVVDFDRVEESNLQRQVIHRQSGLGRSKVLSAAETLAEVNPLVTVVTHEQRLDSSNAMDLFAGYDLIVDGSDNFATRYLVNDAAVLLGKPYVWGSVNRFDGQVSVFWAEHGPCYRCLYPQPPPPGAVPSCAEAGVLGALCGSIGTIQVTEAVKILTGTGEPLVGRLLVHDGLRMTYRTITVRRNPDCALCGDTPTVTAPVDYEAFCGVPPSSHPNAFEDGGSEHDATVSAPELRALLDGPDPVFLVDVREPHEHEIVAIPGSTLIPRGEFLHGDALERLPRDRRVVLHCKSGARSAEVLALVRRAGFADAAHLAGGVLAWVEAVEPDKPTY